MSSNILSFVKDAKDLGKQATTRFQLLDLLRIFAALWVAIYHLAGGHGWFAYLKHPYENILVDGKFGSFSAFIRLGFLGVPIFFVISGFVIVTTSKDRSAIDFLVSRFSRLFPAFIFSVVLTLSVFKFGFNAPYSISFEKLITTLNLSWSSVGGLPIQGSYWSLWPEVRFYGLFMVFVLVLKKTVRFEKKVFIFLLGWLCLNFFSFASSSLLGVLSVSDYGIYFILGGFLALAKDRNSSVGVLPFAFAGMLFGILNLRTWIFAWDPKHQLDWRLGTSIFLISLLIVGASRRVECRNLKVQTVFATAGKASYSFYLLQEGLGMPMTSYLIFHGMQTQIAIALTLLSILLISVGFTLWFEPKLIFFLKRNLGRGMRDLLRN